MTSRLQDPPLTPHQLSELSAMMLDIAKAHKQAAPALRRMAETYEFYAQAARKVEHRA